MITVGHPELLETIPTGFFNQTIVRDVTPPVTYNAVVSFLTTAIATENIIIDNTAFTQEAVYLTDSDTIIITIPDDSYIAQIVINEITFTLAIDPANPSETEFIIVNGEIILPIIVTGIATIVFVTRHSIPNKIRTNYILPPYPNFLTEWNCVGELNINRSFQSHPTVSLAFYTTTPESTIRQTLKKGSIHRFYGMDYEITNLTITRNSADKSGNIYQRKVEVSFEGIWYNKANNRSPLDENIYIKDYVSGSNEVSFNSLCLAKNVSYTGDRITIKVDATIDPETVLTIRNEFESRAIVNNQFVYYSHPDYIWAKTYPYAKFNYLFKTDLKEKEYAVQLSGTGAFVGDVQLTKEYRNTELQFATEEVADQDTSQQLVLYTFENARDLADVLSWQEKELKNGAFYIINNELRFQDNAMNWDSGGLTKSVTRTVYRNGQVVKIEYTKYGFVYTSLDCYNFRQRNDDQWVAHYFNPLQSELYKIVEQWVETPILDSDGYIIDRVKSGFRYHRYQQETENLEVIELRIKYLESTDSAEQLNLLKQIDTYKGFKNDFVENTGIELERFDKYYTEFADSCNSESSYPKKFAKTIFSQQTTQLIEENPEHEENPNKPKDLSTGKVNVSRTEVNIITPRSVSSNQDKKVYETIQIDSNAEGERFKNVLKISNVTQSEGIPSEAERIDLPLETEVNDNINEQQYILNTPNSGLSLSDPIQDSISFPDVDNYLVALKSAKTQLSIDNLNAETMTLNLNQRMDWKEGDQILFEGQYYIILSIDDSQQILKNMLTSINYSVNLGRLLQPSVTVTTRVKTDECTN